MGEGKEGVPGGPWPASCFPPANPFLLLPEDLRLCGEQLFQFPGRGLQRGRGLQAVWGGIVIYQGLFVDAALQAGDLATSQLPAGLSALRS